MSGPQFIHIQTWSAKPNKGGQSIAQVIAEVMRDPEYAGHVETPAPPRPLIGDPSTFAADHAVHVAARSTVATMRDGSERVRAIRSDRHTMASIVMSYPVPRSAIVTDDARAAFARWEAAHVAWLSDTYGDQLRVVVAHDDELHPHLHAWLLPDDPGADATTLHPGKMAKKAAEAEAKQEGLAPREAVKLGNRALKEAMTAWQDAYHEAVGAPLGLTRSGPKRRRLSREQWKAEKATAQAHALTFDRVAALDASSNQISAEAMADRKEACRILLAAKEQREVITQREVEVAEREVNVVIDRRSVEHEWTRLASDRIEIDADRADLEQIRADLVTREKGLSRIRQRVMDLVDAMGDAIGITLPTSFSQALSALEKSVAEYIKKNRNKPENDFSGFSEQSRDDAGPGF